MTKTSDFFYLGTIEFTDETTIEIVDPETQACSDPVNLTPITRHITRSYAPEGEIAPLPEPLAFLRKLVVRIGKKILAPKQKKTPQLQVQDIIGDVHNITISGDNSNITLVIAKELDESSQSTLAHILVKQEKNPGT